MRSRSPIVALAVAALMLPALAVGAAPKEKVEVCHIPPGNPGNAHTISVNGNALGAHLGHGDTEGRCPVERPGRGDDARSDDDDSSDDQTSGNRAPIARAGTDICAVYGTSVTLNGSGSSDQDGDALTYRWTVDRRPTGSTLGTAGFVPNRNAISPSVVPDRLGNYRFELDVTDTHGATDDDFVEMDVYIDVELTAGSYAVVEGETTPFTILFTRLAPQPVTVDLQLDTSVAVVVPEANDVVTDAISSIQLAAGDSRVTLHLLGVSDTDALDDSTVLTVETGTSACGDSAAANVNVEDDDVQLRLGLDRLWFVRPLLGPWIT